MKRVPVGAERQRRDKAARVAEPARRHERDLEPVGGAGNEDEAGDIVLARVTRAFEAVDRDRIDAEPLGFQGMADRGAFVDDLDARGLEHWDVFLGVVPRRLDDLDAGSDDRVHIRIVRHGLDRRQDREIDAEGLVGHLPAARDLLGEVLRRGLCEAGQEAECAGVGDGRDQLGAADPLHAALDDRMLHSEKLGKARLEHEGSFRGAAQFD
jgi:hypothetical protein